MGELQHVQVGDISVGYREGGSGSAPPLVLVMGFAGTMYEWDPGLLERLADQRRVIVFDNRAGHAFMYQYHTLVAKNIGAFLG